MKSKKFLLGALIAVAIGSSAFNLFAADPQDPQELCKWRVENCVCIWDTDFDPSQYQYFCDEDLCNLTIPRDCNPN